MRTTRIFLVRHGHTRLNSAEVVRGLLDDALDETGQLQAQRLGRFLRDAGVNWVATSPLQRARETAQTVAGSCATTAEVVQDLRDRDYGPWTGWPKSEVSERFGRVDNAPGIESTAAFMQRVAIALASVVRAHRGETLAVVGHTAVNRAVFGWFFPGWKGILPRIAQDAACWNCIEVRDDRWELMAVNRRSAGQLQAMRPMTGAHGDLGETPLQALEPVRRIVAKHPWPTSRGGLPDGVRRSPAMGAKYHRFIKPGGE